MGAKKDAKKQEPEEKEGKDKVDLLLGQVSVLKWQIAMEQEKADKARAGQNECRQKLVDLNQAFEEESKRTFNTNYEMKQQYNMMVRDRDEKIQELQEEFQSTSNELSDKEKYIKEIMRSKDQEIEDREDEIKEMRKKIDDMSQEFANMLKGILDKMQERIELANTQWEAEESDLSQIK